MTLADPIGDMITRIRNAQLRTLVNVKIPNSKFRAALIGKYVGEQNNSRRSDFKRRSFWAVMFYLGLRFCLMVIGCGSWNLDRFGV